MISFLTAKLSKKPVLSSFSTTAQTEELWKKLVKQIGENI